MRLRMRGPYRLDNATINANVAKASIGNYALGTRDSETGDFVVEFVGRAETGINAKLKSWVGETDSTHFMFSYAVSLRVAFEKECKLYHALSPPQNHAHPERRPGVTWACPSCDVFGKPRRLLGWKK